MMGTGKLHSSPKRLISTVFFIIRQKVGALKNRVNFKSRRILLKGLDADKRYKVVFENDDSVEDAVYSGDTLMKAGLLVPNPWGDFRARLIYLAEA